MKLPPLFPVFQAKKRVTRIASCGILNTIEKENTIGCSSRIRRDMESGARPGESVTVKPRFDGDKSDTWEQPVSLPEPETR